MTSLTGYWDDSFLDHAAPAGEAEQPWTGRLAVREPHPDRPERLRNVRHILDEELPGGVDWRPVEPVSDETLHRVHDPDYVERFEAFCASGGGRLVGATGANRDSYRAARHAAGAAVAAAEHAIDGDESALPYACVRPSGHHAQPDQADGFCFFNNAAIAAETALAADGIDRVAIVDWDVHHGNGTQAVFEDRDDVLTLSIHNRHGSWHPETHPQTGAVEEHGTGPGVGYNVNVPVPPGTGDEGYRAVFDRLVEPVVEQFDPDLVVVAAGGDAGTVDPLGRNVVTKAGFEALGSRARSLAERTSDGRLVVVQEGGYHVSHLGYAMLGTFEGLLGVDSSVRDRFALYEGDTASATERTSATVDHYATWWDL
jgi:acetoin utilization deacetylase AcuC-like enzyme